MANPHKGEISVDLEGQTYTLALTLNAMVDVEALFGLSFDEVISLAATKGSATHLRALVWAMLRKHHPTITLEQAGDLVTGANLGHLSRTIARVVTASSPDPKDVPAAPSHPTSARPVKGGTGASSISPPGDSG
jgi:hypothetical protein